MKSRNVVAGIEGGNHDVAESERPQPELANGPSLEQIRQRAYELYLEGGCTHGRDCDDWLQAERELVEKHQTR
jgi:Protein of unknown function (DUF2934)